MADASEVVFAHHHPSDCPELPEPEPGLGPESLTGSCPVVGIGASAGGLEAFTQLLKNLPPDTGMGFVLVQHLDPHHESILAELLAVHTEMPVSQATQGTKVEPNRVYIIPPNTAMAIQKGMLRLTLRSNERVRHLPIDYFLCSLAEDQKGRAFGVILSGSASDGTVGLKAIKAVGGITFAQDSTAQFESMPRSAVAASAVDFILPPDAIARELAGIARHSYLDPASPDVPVDDGPVLLAILALLRDVKGADFTHYKRPTITRRLARRMALRQKNDAESYLNLLGQDPGELSALLDDLLINVTEFFRDPDTFEILAKSVFPAILKDRKPENTIRIWVAGCSTGEEVYSIAICLLEYLDHSGLSFPIQIFGTDISDRAIDHARQGKYAETINSVVSPERLTRFYVRLDDGRYQIARSIRDLCLFSRHDLTQDPPLSRMDLISCRNVLIYLGSILQRRVISTFSYALQPTGCLMLGNSESLGSLTEHFVALDLDHKIYTRNLRVAQLGSAFGSQHSPHFTARQSAPLKKDDVVAILDREADRQISEDYGPGSLLLDASYQVIKFRGNVGNYIAPSTGTASLDVFKLIREDLVVSLRQVITEAARTNRVARKEHASVKLEDRVDKINLVARPISKLSPELYFLVSFEETAQQGSREANQMGQTTLVGSTDLADELASTRVYLQSLIEDLRTVNEEAQSANEELQSTNEELQTAKEELQSSNEELTTTNAEMKSRNAELGLVNNDLLNLLSSMQVPVVMLNKDLRIRRFTPLAEQALNLIPTDVGRPISDLKPRINVPDLEQLLAKVIYSLQAMEQEVQDQEGRWYSMRINPYRTADNRVEGAVMQLLDIDELKQTVEAAEHARIYSETIFETVREPLVVLDSELQVKTANQSFFDTFTTSAENTLSQSIFELANRQWDSPNVRRLLEEIRASGQTQLQDVEIEHQLGPEGFRTFQLNARLLKRQDGMGQILLALEDVTDRKRAAEAKYRRLFETAKDGILIIDAASGKITDANAFVLDLSGYRREELIGSRFWAKGPLANLPKGREALNRLLTEESVRFPDVPLKAKGGQNIEVEAIGNVYSEGTKQVIQFNIRDITERKHFERQLRQTAKLESLGLLAGGVAHDFNNLLTSIMGHASLLLEAAPFSSPDREQLREILKASQRAADLTRQMLAYAGKGRYVIKLVDLSEMVEEISALVKSSIPKAVDVELKLAKGLPQIKADSAQMQQLVMNLVINAAEAIGEGHVGVVRVTTSQQQFDDEFIKLYYSADGLKPGTYVILEVSDTGSGMDEATKAKIFDPFFTTKFTGRGLGLSAALGIVRGHEGAIRLYSVPGRGTTFRVLFPASLSRETTQLSEIKAVDLHGTGLVLVVDDEEMVQRVAVAALLRHGYKVLTAPNGAIAVQIVRERGAELALIVLDLMMPVMGGEEALAHIQESHPEIPVILSSGYDYGQTEGLSGETRLAGFIQKPYTAQQLLEIVKSKIVSL